MVGSSPAALSDRPSSAAEQTPEQVAERLGRAFVDALVDADLARLEALFAPDVRFRALIPPAVREADSAAGARSLVHEWFGETDRRELQASNVDLIGDRVHVGYRLRVRERGSWSVVEQHVVAAIGHERLTDVALLCSGFRPAPEAPDAERRDDRTSSADPGAAPGPWVPEPDDRTVLLADARLDAIGRSCATLTPTIRAAVARLEPGQVLEIVADDPSAREGLQSWTRLTGHELVAAVTTPDAASRFYVRRAEVRSPAEGNPKGAGR